MAIGTSQPTSLWKGQPHQSGHAEDSNPWTHSPNLEARSSTCRVLSTSSSAIIPDLGENVKNSLNFELIQSWIHYEQNQDPVSCWPPRDGGNRCELELGHYFFYSDLVFSARNIIRDWKSYSTSFCCTQQRSSSSFCQDGVSDSSSNDCSCQLAVE